MGRSLLKISMLMFNVTYGLLVQELFRNVVFFTNLEVIIFFYFSQFTTMEIEFS